MHSCAHSTWCVCLKMIRGGKSCHCNVDLWYIGWVWCSQHLHPRNSESRLSGFIAILQHNINTGFSAFYSWCVLKKNKNWCCTKGVPGFVCWNGLNFKLFWYKEIGVLKKAVREWTVWIILHNAWGFLLQFKATCCERHLNLNIRCDDVCSRHTQRNVYKNLTIECVCSV